MRRGGYLGPDSKYDAQIISHGITEFNGDKITSSSCATANTGWCQGFPDRYSPEYPPITTFPLYQDTTTYPVYPVFSTVTPTPAYGWICPKCNTVNAPWKDKCDCS